MRPAFFDSVPPEIRVEQRDDRDQFQTPQHHHRAEHPLRGRADRGQVDRRLGPDPHQRPRGGERRDAHDHGILEARSEQREERGRGGQRHGEEHEDEHGEEEEGEHDEHEGERIFSNTESDKFDVRGSFNIDSNLVSKVDFFIRDTDYSLTEQHAEEEEHEEEGHDEDEHEGHEEGPTTFTNDALEAGFIFDLSNDFMSQKFALNFVNEDTSVLGSEAFMNPASRDELTFGYYISQDISDSLLILV